MHVCDGLEEAVSSPRGAGGEVPPNSGLAPLRGWPADIGEGAYL